MDYQVLLRRWPQLIQQIDRLVHAAGHLKKKKKKKPHKHIHILIHAIRKYTKAIYDFKHLPVGKRTRRDKTAARLPLHGSKAIGLGHSYETMHCYYIHHLILFIYL